VSDTPASHSHILLQLPSSLEEETSTRRIQSACRPFLLAEYSLTSLKLLKKRNICPKRNYNENVPQGRRKYRDREEREKEGEKTYPKTHKCTTHANRNHEKPKEKKTKKDKGYDFRQTGIFAVSLRINVSSSSFALKKKSFCNGDGDVAAGVFGCVLVFRDSFRVTLEALAEVVSIFAGRCGPFALLSG
jgi:hypothetical protein